MMFPSDSSLQRLGQITMLRSTCYGGLPFFPLYECLIFGVRIALWLEKRIGRFHETGIVLPRVRLPGRRSAVSRVTSNIPEVTA